MNSSPLLQSSCQRAGRPDRLFPSPPRPPSEAEARLAKLEQFYGSVAAPSSGEAQAHFNARLTALEALAKLQHDYSMGHINPQLMPSRIEIDGASLVYLPPPTAGGVGPAPTSAASLQPQPMAAAEPHPMPQPLSPPPRAQHQAPQAAQGGDTGPQ